MKGRRFSPSWSTLEQLEVRSLLSGTATAMASLVALKPDDDGQATLVLAPAAEIQVDRSAVVRPDGGDRISDTRTVSARTVSSAASSRGSITVIGAARGAHAQNTASREFLDATVVLNRHLDFEENGQADESASSTQDGLLGGSGGTGTDAPDTPTFLGWASAKDTPIVGFLSLLPGSLLGPGMRTKAGPGNIRTSAVHGDLELDLALAEVAPDTAGTPIKLRLATQHYGAVATSDHLGAVWAQLLNGALHSDWEAVDGELGQFLVSLRSLGDDPSGLGASLIWPMGIGMAAAMIVAGRASARQRLFWQQGQRPLWGPSRPRCPVGALASGSPT